MNKINKKDFYKQLKAFQEDKSYFENYDDAHIKSDKFLIRLFRYTIQEKKKSNILIPTEDGGVTTNFEATGKLMTNVAMVIKAGTRLVKGSAEYKPGDLVVVNKAQTIGLAPNPDFMLLHQYSRMGGNAEPIKPIWMKEQVPAIQANWVNYQFTLPHEFDLPTQSIFTFAIPEHEIVYEWEY